MKDKNGLIISLIIVMVVILVGCYLGYKLFLISYYNDKGLDYSFEEISNSYKVNESIEVKTQELAASEYLLYNDVKIRDDFKDYESEEHSDVTGNYIVYTNSLTKNYISLGEAKPYLKYLHLNDFDSREEIQKGVTYGEVSKYLKENHVDSDQKLFAFLAENNYKNNLFSNSKKIKGSYGLYYVASILNPHNSKIINLKGDLDGYVFVQEGNVTEINILKNKKRYVIVMVGEYFTSELVKDLLKTIVIAD